MTDGIKKFLYISGAIIAAFVVGIFGFMVDPMLGYIITGTASIVALLASVFGPFVSNGTL